MNSVAIASPLLLILCVSVGHYDDMKVIRNIMTRQGEGGGGGGDEKFGVHGPSWNQGG